MRLRSRLYRGLIRSVVERWVVPRLDPHPERFRIAADRLKSLGAAPGALWFHAASAGELESLWTVAKRFAGEPGCRLVLTCFSTSALMQVEKLASECAERGAQVLYSGASPFEGDWQSVIAAVQPRAFVTFKYEAWPELWGGLSAQDVPLVIVGARERGSLRLARNICRALGFRLPRTLLLPTDQAEAARLNRILPESQIQVVADPRWERVLETVRRPSSRLLELLQAVHERPRPWGVLAQVWPEDISVWKQALERENGTVFVVPHRVDEESVQAVLRALGAERPLRSSQGGEAGRGWGGQGAPLVLDEMGVLVGLYAKMDWAYVGGGFGKGTHSTLEPAALGLPVSCGPTGITKAPETRALLDAGQLSALQGPEDVKDWLLRLRSESESTRLARQSAAQADEGGSEAAFQAIQRFLPH